MKNKHTQKFLHSNTNKGLKIFLNRGNIIFLVMDFFDKAFGYHAILSHCTNKIVLSN